MKNIVIYHNADFDGLFCYAIAKNFLPPGAVYIGWNHGDEPIPYNKEDRFFILDLNPDCLIGAPEHSLHMQNVVWIDHHKTAIEKWSPSIPGYRIDGVSACRLSWQWFWADKHGQFNGYVPQEILPKLEWYHERMVIEPLAVRLAGEYDIWDKRDPRAELFQFGLKSVDLDGYCYIAGLSNWWLELLSESQEGVNELLKNAKFIQCYRNAEYKEVITSQGFDVIFEELSFLACCSHEADIRSQLFEAAIEPHHDGLLGFTFTGTKWRVSLYGVPGKPDIDLSVIARKYGGGGHKQACGFMIANPPWLSKLHLMQSKGFDLDAVRDFLEGVVPDRNCMCHTSPPCGWCVEYGHIYEQLEILRGKK